MEKWVCEHNAVKNENTQNKWLHKKISNFTYKYAPCPKRRFLKWRNGSINEKISVLIMYDGWVNAVVRNSGKMSKFCLNRLDMQQKAPFRTYIQKQNQFGPKRRFPCLTKNKTLDMQQKTPFRTPVQKHYQSCPKRRFWCLKMSNIIVPSHNKLIYNEYFKALMQI